MRPTRSKLAGAIAVGALFGCVQGAPSGAVPPGGCAALGQQVAVIVQLADRVELSRFAELPPSQRRARIAGAIEEQARRNLPPLRAFLAAHGARRVVPLPIANAIAASVPRELLGELARFPGVEEVRLDARLSAPPVTYGSAAPDWNLAAIDVTPLWSQGLRGAGVVVANMDTGVDGQHADLAGRWRGGANSWFDPFDHSATPIDPIGHGTQTMGLIAGGDASGAPIGVAPDARWIAARIYDASGNTSTSVLHQAFGWLLDPDGDPSTDDAPDVVSASWGSSAPGTCDPEFEPDLEALRAAGIVVVFAAGNSGPGAGSSVSPANEPGVLSAGAVDQTLQLASFSSRGPSACTGGLFPQLVAPGVNVRTTDLSFAGTPQYATVSGTSYAAPQLAGVAALLRSTNHSLTPAQIEDALRASARDLGEAGPDDGFGHGLVDAAAALHTLETNASQAPVLAERALPAAHLETPYRQSLALGEGLTRWQLDSGALPPGLVLDPTTGVLAGTPEAPGRFAFVVRTGSASTADQLQPFTLAVTFVSRPLCLRP
jgi:subtilisin family serine protease